MKARLIIEGWGTQMVEHDAGVKHQTSLMLRDGTFVNLIFEPEWMTAGSLGQTMKADGEFPDGCYVPMWLTDVKVVRPKGWKRK